MGVTACCILVFVAMACVHGLAQEGGIHEVPKQEGTYIPPKQGGTYMPPQQGGTYVPPKQGGTYVPPKQGGTYMPPKQEGTDVKLKQEDIYVEPKQSCGSTLTVDNGGTTITSPGYPSNYGRRQRCVWRIAAQDPAATLRVECSSFNAKYSRGCRGYRMLIYEDGVLSKLFCGTGNRSFSTKGHKISMEIRTNQPDTRRDFSCLVRSTGTCTCGVANPNRIVGGKPVKPAHKYPWQVGIKRVGGSNYWCGGSIINTDYVMSAAHCFLDSSGNSESVNSLVVGVADHNMYSTTDNVSGVTRLVKVKKVLIHPSYSPSNHDYDIALLKLQEKLNLSQHKQLRAVCLPENDSKTYAGLTATAIGWGTLSSGGQQPAILQEVSLPILPRTCWNMQGITQRMLCAGYKNGSKDTCQGDSGGPLHVKQNSKYVQVGITSWGIGCAQPNHPGVYTRVSKFLRWIKSNTADATYCR